MPPALQLDTPFEKTSWTAHRLPEIVWIAVFHQSCGPVAGTELVLELANAAEQQWRAEKHQWWGAASAFGALGEEQLRAVVQNLRKRRVLGKIQRAVRPFIACYPSCPLSFLFGSRHPSLRNHGPWLPAFKALLGRLLDRNAREAVILQAAAASLHHILGHMSTAQGIPVPSVEGVLEYPETPESQHVAGVSRALVSQLVMMRCPELITPWTRYFWNRGLAIESCEHEEFAQ